MVTGVDNSLILRGVIVPALGPAGELGVVPTFRHSTGDYVRAALSTGLVIRRFEEPSLNDQNSERHPAPERGKMEPGPWENWPWTLMWLIPDVIEALTDPHRRPVALPNARVAHSTRGLQRIDADVAIVCCLVRRRDDGDLVSIVV